MNKNMHRVSRFLGFALILPAYTAFAGEHVVVQKDKMFPVPHLVVKAGDSIKFTNDDPFYHNIFSLTEGSSFDLGSYGQGQARTIKLTQPGAVRVECAIHPEMVMDIEVQK